MTSPLPSDHEELPPSGVTASASPTSEPSAPDPSAPEQAPRASGEVRAPEKTGRRVIAKRYRIDEVLAEGGMAVVYRGWHLPLDEPIAIKILKREYADNEEAVTRFLQEARAGALLRGKNVAQVLDIGRLESGPPFMVTQLLKGHDLQGLLEARGRLPVSTTLRLVKDICTAVADVHQSGIVHRDLKPANIFIARDGDGEPLIKLLDFGIAKRLDGRDLNDTKNSLGSPHYMAPEQIMSAEAVDVRADIWSLGIVLFELLTGRVPFDADTIPAQCAQVLNSPCPAPSEFAPEIPPELDAVILRCLEKEPHARYASMLELRKALEGCEAARRPPPEAELVVPVTICEPPQPVAPAMAPVRPLDEVGRRRRVRFVAAAVAACAGLLTLSFSPTRDAVERAYGGTQAAAARTYASATRALTPHWDRWFHDAAAPTVIAPPATTSTVRPVRVDAPSPPPALTHAPHVSAAPPEVKPAAPPARTQKPVPVKRPLPLPPLPPRVTRVPVPATPTYPSLGQHPDPVERRYALTATGNTAPSQDLINPYPDMSLK